jgi:glutamate carboxypeptidase
MSALPDSASVRAHLAGQRDRMVALLRRLTEAESPSVVPDAQAGLRELLVEAFDELGYVSRRVSGQSSGGMLYARPARRSRGRPSQLLLGHYDTVWPLGTLADMPFEVDGDVVRGPGVYDMKGGIVQGLLALDTIRHFGVEPAVTPVAFFNSDEEIGSRDSRRHIESLARRVDRVFVLEPSLGPGGKLKTTRKGIGRFTVRVKGEAAHAGLDPGKGASAILELSHVIQSLFALNDLDRGITVNVGNIDGGLRPNVVAPESTAIADVRVATLADAEAVETSILGLRPVVPGTELRIEGGFGRPALEPTPANRALWDQAQRLGADLGLKLEEAQAGGGSDGNTTSRYTATLDGLGAVGDGAHARHEHLRIGATLERAALLAMLLMQPPLDGAMPGGS